MLIETYLDKSRIHGLGLFCAKPVQKGAQLWRFAPGFDLEYSEEQMSVLPEVTRAWCQQFAYLDYHFQKYIICADDARFINHSDDANVFSDYSIDPYGIDIAVRDLKAGEELTANYGEFEHPEHWLQGLSIP